MVTSGVVVGIKDTEFWKQFTTPLSLNHFLRMLLLVSKILNSESNSQPKACIASREVSCCWYQRYWILKAIHNNVLMYSGELTVVVGIKDTEFWKQFTTNCSNETGLYTLLLVSKILNSESNSQHNKEDHFTNGCCCWYQRYWILKAIHNLPPVLMNYLTVVVGIKDTEFWKQFTTFEVNDDNNNLLLLVSKILNSESNSQLLECSVI